MMIYYTLFIIYTLLLYYNLFIYIYIYIVIVVIVIFIWWSPFIPSRNLDEVVTYNHIYGSNVPSKPLSY